MLAFGDNQCGQLGLGDRVSRNLPTPITLPLGSSVVEIACGSSHSLLRLADGRVLGLGYKFHLPIGLEGGRRQFGARLIPTPITLTLPQGVSVVEMACSWHHSLLRLTDGCVLAYSRDEFGPLRLESRVVEMACGSYHSLLRLADGHVMAFGLNDSGQLGLEDGDNRNVPTPITKLPLGVSVVEMACGANHSLLRLADGRVLAFGNNKFGQLGLGDTADRNFPTLITLPLRAPIVEMACGGDHSLLRLADGRVLAFGNNSFGQLGLEDGDNRNVPTPITKLPLGVSVVEMACGANHSLLRLADGRVLAFGNNSFGQLGMVDTDDRNTPCFVRQAAA